MIHLAVAGCFPSSAPHDYLPWPKGLALQHVKAMLARRKATTIAAPQGIAATGLAVNDKPDISHQQKDGCRADSPPADAASFGDNGSANG